MRVSPSIYNHLSTQVVPKKRNITHNSSELKAIYTKMAKYNRNSPLYLLSVSDTKQTRMIGIKEAALTLKDVTDTFANPDSTVYSHKQLHSDSPNEISGAIKSSDYGDIPDSLDISVSSLATEQVNIGNYLPMDEKDFGPGNYKFSLDILGETSNFSMQIDDETNLEVQKKLAQYINARNLDVEAHVVAEDNESALLFSSRDTGRPQTAEGLYFSFHNDSNIDIVSRLGLNNIDTYPSNSHFSINGQEHTSSSNNISINQAIELDFHSPTSTPVTISLVPDTNIAMEQVDAFIDAYNGLVDMADSKEPAQVGSRNLFNDISGIVGKHKDELEQAGLLINENNKMEKDTARIEEGIRTGSFAKLFTDLSTFKDDVASVSNRLTIDPVAYVNKVVVTYPNPAQKMNTPYTQSLYSGMMYNNYA